MSVKELNIDGIYIHINHLKMITLLETYCGMYLPQLFQVIQVHTINPVSLKFILLSLIFTTMKRDSSVDIATGYGLDDRGVGV
jgi:hypothetical protein